MICSAAIKNDEPIMEHLRFIHCQCWVLCVEIGNIGIGQFCACVSVYFYIDTNIFLGQYIQSIDINVSINQNDFLFCFLNPKVG